MVVSLSSSTINLPVLSTVKSKDSLRGSKKPVKTPHMLDLQMRFQPVNNTQRFQSTLTPCPAVGFAAQQPTHKQKMRSSTICSAALGARCGGAEQTQTVTREAPTITQAPIHIQEKSPQLDDGGTGFPPRDDSGGGGGGGGGGGNWSGGFFFFGFLAFLGFLKDKESDGDYNNDRRR